MTYNLCHYCRGEFHDGDVLIPLVVWGTVEGTISYTTATYGSYIHYRHLNEVAVLA